MQPESQGVIENTHNRESPPYSMMWRYTYESGGRLTKVADAEGNPFAAYTYTDAGNIDTHTMGDNIVTGNYAYNDRD